MGKQIFGPSSDPLAAPIAKTLKIRAADQHLMLGLGAALVLHWDSIPDAVQDLLIDQAVIVLDADGFPDRRSEVETVIRQAKAVALASGK